MHDIVDQQTRSAMMAGIKSKNTKPELIVRKFLHRSGFRFRLHYKKLPGKPDIVLPKHRLAIFVNGCFWHQHTGCKNSNLPKTRREFWKNKLDRNVDRDKNQHDAIMSYGWRVIVIWECAVRADESLFIDLPEIIKGNQAFTEYPSKRDSLKPSLRATLLLDR